MKRFARVILCIALFVASGCDKSDSSIEFVYPETGKYGLNILAEGFVKASKNELGSSNPVVYSVRAELPVGNSSLKIVVKSAKQKLYECRNSLYDHYTLLRCGFIFYEWHKICPKCGGMNTIHEMVNRFIKFYPGSEVNWLIPMVGDLLTFTYVDELVHKSGKIADASVAFDDDCIIEYYENGAIEPTKVKEVKVID